MSSLEIAQLTEKRHDHVMRDARSVLIELHGVGGLPSFGDTHRNEQNGQSYPIFRLPKRECLILVLGYSVALRAAIIDRRDELERQVAHPAIPNFANPAEAARAWAAEFEQVQLAQAKVVERQRVAKVGELASSLGHRVRTERRRARQRPRVRPGYATTLQTLAGVPAQTSGSQMGIEGGPFRCSSRIVFAHPRLPLGDVRPGSHETTGREDG